METYVSEVKRMDPAAKAEWVKYLRAGVFKQGRQALQATSGEYCCLGVLCTINGLPSTFDPSEYSFDFVYKESKESSVLPIEFAHSLGLATTNGAIFSHWEQDGNGAAASFYEPGMSQETLAGLNDLGFTFDQIADLIDYFL